MRINDAFFMRTTDPTDQCRLAVGGKPKWGYFTTWDYQFHNDIPGATFEEAWNMEWDLVPHLISENGAVFSDVHDGSCYVRGNINQVVEDGGPIMVLQNEMIGVQGSIVRVLSNAFGVKEVLLDGEPIACGERVFNAPQVDTTAENEHKVTFVTGIKVNDSFPVQEKKQVKIFSPQPGKLLNHLIRNRLYDMDFSESRSCRSSKTKKIYMQSRYEKICFYFYFCIGICGICCRNG